MSTDPTFTQTVQTPSVVPPVQTGAPAGLLSFNDYVNAILQAKLGTAIVKKQKMQYSILHFADFQEGWWLCEVENLSGNTVGDDLLIVIAKTTPIMFYPAGAVSPPPFTVQ